MTFAKSKILVVVGPTSSGKSELAVALARRFNGEIISADSRQIYRGMDLGTGKIDGRWKSVDGKKTYLYKNIPHHLIDFVNPRRQYSAALYKEQAEKIIGDIIRRGKLPIICGGTAHWIDAVIYNQILPEVKPNAKLRAKLEKKSADNLFQQLKKLDSHRAKNIDQFNKRRLIRALEIVITTGKPVPLLNSIPSEAVSRVEESINNRPLHSSNALVGRGGIYDALWIGINPSRPTLFSKIKKRLRQRLDQGMLKEIRDLHHDGLSWKRLESFGLEYKFGALHLQKKISYEEMFNQLLFAIQNYSKRQMTWWKRDKNILWIDKPTKAAPLVKKFQK